MGPQAQLSIVRCDFVDNQAGPSLATTDGQQEQEGQAVERLGDAVIWSSRQPSNCANGTSACWGNALALSVP